MSNLILFPNKDENIEIEYNINIEEPKLLIGSKEQNDEINFDVNINEIEYTHFETGLSEYEKVNYLIAGASGILSGLLNIFWSKEFNIDEAQKWGSEKIEKFVITVAKMQGCKENDIKSAIKFLEKKFPIVADTLTNKFGGGYSHHLRDFSHHPTVIGLIASILNQYGIGIGTDANGDFRVYEINSINIGKTFEEKIFNGVIVWAFHLVSDMAGSSSNPGKGTGIPGILLSFFKELSTLPIIKDIHSNYKEEDIQISVIISKLFNGTYFRDLEGNPIRIDLRAEIGVLAQQSKSVLVNECVVRAFYTLRSLYKEITSKEITNITELNKIKIKNILPCNSRELNRMLTISYGTFILIDLSKAVVKSKCKDLVKFLLNINYVGIGRFAIACKADAGYIEEDVRKTINNYIYKQNQNHKPYFTFEMRSLTSHQQQILDSLKLKSIIYDISMTKNEKDKKIKEKWCEKWKEKLCRDNNNKNYFIEDSNNIYVQLNKSQNEKWIYILIIELYLFKPYYQLNKDDVIEKNVKLNKSYFEDVLKKQQRLVLDEDLNKIIKVYNNYYNNVLQNKKNKTIIGLSTTVAVTVVTGGAGWFFAPQIATMIAGEAVAGLSGAALTSASLAFVGGGSLATGGLGMAGGTAILSGGGALIGLASSGVTSITTNITRISDKFILVECAKLLTFCKIWLIDKKQDKTYVIKIQKCIDELIDKLNISMSKEKDKKRIKQIKNNIKYLNKCRKALNDLIL